MPKICPRCREHLPLSSFGTNKAKGKGGTQSYCKACNKRYHNSRYTGNKALYRDKDRVWRVKSKKRNRKLLWEYLQEHPCVDCGEIDPIVLEFDHLDTSSKMAAVSDWVCQGIRWERILEEIKKCVVRCANCHKKRTAKQFDWYKDIRDVSSVG